ncbi:MAG TPA: hypothetical protein VHX86_17330 [Tepidisphaeraceae bacterium]|jgi:uncharacterized membrane protein YqjE|nr:hypothetical protein [Tepidisphaeraceae bacterium]
MISLAFIGRLSPQLNQMRLIFLMTIAMEGLYFVAILAVLVIRIFYPAYRRWPTVAINIILILWPPFGTALAIYGFLKVDKKIPEISN